MGLGGDDYYVMFWVFVAVYSILAAAVLVIIINAAFKIRYILKKDIVNIYKVIQYGTLIFH